MKRYILGLAACTAAMGAAAQTDAYIKLRDEKKTHPRIDAITFPATPTPAICMTPSMATAR